jgi:putative ABC transport system ATP-binding protein
MTALLVAEAITSTIADHVVLEDVSLEIHAGQSLALLGPSGSGKTALLSTLSGMARPRSGRISVEMRDTDHDGRGDMAIVLQTFGLIALLTAAENVEIALLAKGYDRRVAKDRAAEVLDSLDVARFADHLVDELSGGQEQRVAVARALSVRPRLLLADEPTSEQDPEHREVVIEHLFAASQDGAGLVIATHDEQVADRCGRVFELGAGTGRYRLPGESGPSDV